MTFAWASEADLWRVGRTGNVIRAMSLVPDEVRTVVDLSDAHYLPEGTFMVFTGKPYGTLTRLQMEVIADATGIPLDEATQVMSEELRAELGINEYISAANTRTLGRLRRFFLKLIALPRMKKVVRRESGVD